MLGSATILSSVIALRCGEAVVAWLLHLSAGLGGPLAAVCLLGMFSHRSTSAAALAALRTGAWVGMAVSFVGLCATSARFGQVDLPLQANWLPLCGFALSLTVGVLGSRVGGRKKSREQLRGLVAGIGKWGIRQPDPAVAIPRSFDESSDESFDAATSSTDDPPTAP